MNNTNGNNHTNTNTQTQTAFQSHQTMRLSIGMANINGRYGGGSGVCEYTFGPVTSECGLKASEKHALEPKAIQKHAPGPRRRLPKST